VSIFSTISNASPRVSQFGIEHLSHPRLDQRSELRVASHARAWTLVFVRHTEDRAHTRRRQIVTNSAEVLRAGVLASIGMAILPLWAIADDLRDGTLSLVLPTWAPPPGVMLAAYPGNRRISAKVRVFVDHLARHIGRTPYWEL
jgi:DNA-binding transcriptional LysR family regulator